ncbi:pannexin-3 [Tenrec ecaudatus]|uniref:pannexin-3 n=1 Tax=Tenrec ecaudatus TaxID=94439 RepID=UPI003F591836
MSLAHTVSEFMLSDALLPEYKSPQLKGLRLELPLDKMVKFVAVGFPLLLISLAFAQEFSFGTPISCFAPSNFSAHQAAYVDSSCWDSLVHYKQDEEGQYKTKSLWPHKVIPYSLLALTMVMYLPVLLWQYTAVPALSSDLLFIIRELDKSYNRSIRLVQHMVKIQKSSESHVHVFWDELEKARRNRYFEFPLLEHYLACKQRSHSLVASYLLRNALLLIFISTIYLYLGHFHLDIFFQEEFSCSIKRGLLNDETHVPHLITCRLTFLSLFQIVSLSCVVMYTLLVPVILYNITQLCRWDKQLLSIYEMLPAFDLLSRKRLGCPFNDLNVILLFLRANTSKLISFSWLSALCVLKDTTTQKQNIDTVVDFMTLLAGLETLKPKHPTHCVSVEPM